MMKPKQQGGLTGRLFTIKLLWRERGRVWRWYLYYRTRPYGWPMISNIKTAIRATIENPPNADDWLQGKLDYLETLPNDDGSGGDKAPLSNREKEKT